MYSLKRSFVQEDCFSEKRLAIGFRLCYAHGFPPLGGHAEGGNAMDPAPWSPLRELAPLRKEMDSLFRRFWGELPFTGTPAEEWLPSMDVSETADSIVVKAELPGMEAKDIDVSILGDRLTIKGEKKKEEEKKGEHFHSMERYYGSFQRSFRLPSTVNMDKIEAGFDKGILTITLPKTEEAKTKEIKIEVK